MPRPPRDLEAGLFHVWVNATGNWDYFVDEVDRIFWIRLLVANLRRHNWGCVAFCQMTTHVHLILDVPADSLALGMRDLNREYAAEFNARHRRLGAFNRKRYGSRRIESREDLLTTYPYVVLNPWREGMCGLAEAWRWSSYRTTLGLARDFPFVDASVVLGELGGSVAALRELVDGAAEREWLDRTRSVPGTGRVPKSRLRPLD